MQVIQTLSEKELQALNQLTEQVSTLKKEIKSYSDALVRERETSARLKGEVDGIKSAFDEVISQLITNQG